MGWKVLIVDDSGVMRKMITRALRQTGIEFSEHHEAGNGVEALEVLKEHTVDLILCDWNMPEMDGITFLKEARKTYTTPVMMLSTEGTSDKVSEAMAAGAQAYVTKPFTPEKLKERITVVMGNAA
ncbi:MAG: two-component system chemotaxis response regulator CheY [Planctomycetota bacterium]|jgi:two-component system chemotaxis response regulator CheY